MTLYKPIFTQAALGTHIHSQQKGGCATFELPTTVRVGEYAGESIRFYGGPIKEYARTLVQGSFQNGSTRKKSKILSAQWLDLKSKIRLTTLLFPSCMQMAKTKPEGLAT